MASLKDLGKKYHMLSKEENVEAAMKMLRPKPKHKPKKKKVAASQPKPKPQPQPSPPFQRDPYLLRSRGPVKDPSE